MNVSLTELRQRLFRLADRVVETGEPLIVMRNGVRLRLVRDDTVPAADEGRLARLKTRQAWIGTPPEPHFSPSQWGNEYQALVPEKRLSVAEPPPEKRFGNAEPLPEKRFDVAEPVPKKRLGIAEPAPKNPRGKTRRTK